MKNGDKLFAKADDAWERGDLQKAFELFLHVAELGDCGSQRNVGYFFDRGLHVKKDEKVALSWYHKAYLQGDARGASNSATVHRDYGRTGKMVWWFRRAVRIGDHDALLELGKCYETGTGVSKSPKLAMICYRRLLDSNETTEFSEEEAAKRLARLTKKRATGTRN